MPRKELNKEQITTIIAYQKLNMSGREIARKLNLVPSTVNRLIKSFKNSNSNKKVNARGRPPKLSERSRRYLQREINKKPIQTIRDFTRELPVEVSTSTIRRSLHDSGIYGRIATPKPYISPKNAQKRLNWCRERVTWGEEEFKRIIWSDECSIEIGENSKVVYAWRKSKEKWRPQCLRPTFKSGRKSVMVWGCFLRGNLGPLVILSRGSINGKNYMKILEEYFFDFWQTMSEEMGLVLFQEDNAPIHTSNLAKNWRTDMGIEELPWPPQSPDLNPIEQIWKILKDSIQDRKPPVKRVEDLEGVLQEEWKRLDLEKVNDLVESLPNRISEVIKQKGFNTHY